MTTNEKEYNDNQFDQLTLLERIKKRIKTGSSSKQKLIVNVG